MTESKASTTRPKAVRDRLASAVDLSLQPNSLVGSFFHATADKGWQGWHYDTWEDFLASVEVAA